MIDTIIQIIGEVAVLLIVGWIVTFTIWKLKKRNGSFSEFFNRNGEKFAYLGLLIIAIVVIIYKLK